MYRSAAQKARRREGDKIGPGLHIGPKLLDELWLNLRKLSWGLASAASGWAMLASKFSQDATLPAKLGTVLAICRVQNTITCSGGDSCARCRCCCCGCGGWNTRVANNRTNLAKVRSKYSVPSATRTELVINTTLSVGFAIA